MTHGPCWRSGTVLEFLGPPQERPGAQGRNAAPSGGGKGEPAPVTHDHHWECFQGTPKTPTPSRPFTRRGRLVQRLRR
jgi:hypothetical protein